MRVMWRLERGSFEQVRDALPKRARRAYTTIQTVLNRLAERGLLRRERVGKTIFYSPRASEAEYLSRSLNRTLSGASPEARRAMTHLHLGLGASHGPGRDLSGNPPRHRGGR